MWHMKCFGKRTSREVIISTDDTKLYRVVKKTEIDYEEWPNDFTILE